MKKPTAETLTKKGIKPPGKTKEKKGSEKKKFQGKPKPKFEKKSMGKNHATFPSKTVNAGEKQNWTEFKKEKKDLREKRRAKRLTDRYDVMVQAKKIGEELRSKKLSNDLNIKLTKKLYDLVKNQYIKMVFTHDMSRIVQWQIAHSNSDIQLAIIQELKPALFEIFRSKYAKGIIRKFIKKGSDTVKRIVVESCFGNVVKLVSNVISAPLFEKIYVEVASEQEKIKLKQEFYGDEFKESKDPKIKTLTDVFERNKYARGVVLTSLKATLVRILNKNLINSTLVHTILHEYLSNCSKEDRTEMIVLLRELFKELSQSRDGAIVGMMCIWYGTNKDRKVMIKHLKDNVKNILTSENGYLMIIAILDSVDDTVLLKKVILSEIFNDLKEIALNEHGKFVIQYLVARRNTRFFHPKMIELIKAGDENETSKKPSDVREKELLNMVIDKFLESVAEDPKTWLSNATIQLVTLAILEASEGEKPKSAFAAIANFITNQESLLTRENATIHVIEDAGLHMILKKIISRDKKQIEVGGVTFSEILIEYLTDEALEKFTSCNRGCFLLVDMIKCGKESTVSSLKKILNKSKIALNSKTFKGANILLEKLESQ